MINLLRQLVKYKKIKLKMQKYFWFSNEKVKYNLKEKCIALVFCSPGRAQRKEGGGGGLAAASVTRDTSSPGGRKD